MYECILILTHGTYMTNTNITYIHNLYRKERLKSGGHPRMYKCNIYIYISVCMSKADILLL